MHNTEIIQERYGGLDDRMVAVRDGDKWSGSGCIMNLEPIRFPNVWIFVRNERKVKDSSRFSD